MALMSRVIPDAPAPLNPLAERAFAESIVLRTYQDHAYAFQILALVGVRQAIADAVALCLKNGAA